MAWARDFRRQSMSFRDLRAAMEQQGHRHIYSNGARYLDVRFQTAKEQAETLEREVPPIQQVLKSGDLLDLDRAIECLITLRARFRQ